MRRKPQPVLRWQDYSDPTAPCRQRTQICHHSGDCIRCFAWMGEACRLPKETGHAD